MSRPAIIVEGLGKAYQIGLREQGYSTLRDAIVDIATAPFRRLRKLGGAAANGDDTFWALKDVSFEVQPGEVVGIIGRNGAGKSTLLKILSRITEPTTGQAVLRGRVASLLEVGTGFHPELTGRENIYLNGAILGMKRVEITRKFDEIVAFSEIEKFLDTPVKRYSSGMYVRLAFAVAAHLEPEILIVDEVLAVGDAEFQKKCLGKMQEVSKGGGRTVLFVSHNMAAILRLCPKALFLAGGCTAAYGETMEVTGRYMASDNVTGPHRSWKAGEAPGDTLARLRSVTVRKTDGSVCESIDVSESVQIEVEYESLQCASRPVVLIQISNENGAVLFATSDYHVPEWTHTPRRVGIVRSLCTIPAHFLAEGRFCSSAAIITYEPFEAHAVEPEAVCFQVIDRTDGEGVRGKYGRNWPGLVRPMLQWTVDYAD